MKYTSNPAVAAFSGFSAEQKRKDPFNRNAADPLLSNT
jgi:hypothetical protein